jgi:hypothetical protein
MDAESDVQFQEPKKIKFLDLQETSDFDQRKDSRVFKITMAKHKL